MSIRRCRCGAYTLHKTHCGPTHRVEPPKYSPHDRMGDYRRAAKEEVRKAQGLL